MYCRNYENVETVVVYANSPYIVTVEPAGNTKYGKRKVKAYITKLDYPMQVCSNVELSCWHYNTRKVLYHTVEQSTLQIAYNIVRCLEERGSI